MTSSLPCPPHVALIRGRKQGYINGYTDGYKQALKTHEGIIIEEPKEQSIFLNIKTIIEKQKGDKDPEQYVKKRFEYQGYECEDCRMAGGGHPDYIFRKNKEILYVEVKSPSDGLKMNQAKWMLQNPDKNIILFYVDMVDS